MTLYPHIARLVFEQPWAILPEYVGLFQAILSERASGFVPSPEEIRARIGADPGELKAASGMGQQRQGTVAVLPLSGVISQKMNLMSEMSGGTSTERFAQSFRQAMADPTVGAVLLEVDSPGGGVYGISELADEIYAARGQKPIVAIANSMAASAAYWLASAADEVVVTPSGEVGSIGVFTMHEDTSALNEKIGVKTTLISAGRYKTESNPYEPLAPGAMAAIQDRVNQYYDAFTAAVARQRGVQQRDVMRGYGEGRVVGARDAVREGMADRVGTFDETVARLMRAPARKPMNTRSQAEELDFRRRRNRALAR